MSVGPSTRNQARMKDVTTTREMCAVGDDEKWEISWESEGTRLDMDANW